jgi:hypothetical protein
VAADEAPPGEQPASPVDEQPGPMAGEQPGSMAGEQPGPARPATPSREDFVADYERLAGNVTALARHYRRDRRQIYRWIAAHGLRAASR